MNTKFSISEIVNSAWEIVKNNIAIFIVPTLIFFLIYYVLYILILGGNFLISMNNPSELNAIAFLTSMIGFIFLMMILSIFYSFGIYRVALQAVDGNKPDASAFKVPFSLIIKGIAAGFLFAIAFYIGFLLCIVPGIYIAIRLQFFLFYLIDREECGPVDALKLSWERTKGEEMELFVFFLVMMLISFLGALCCGVGTLISTPIINVSLALLYRRGTSTPGSPTENTDTDINNNYPTTQY